MGREVTTLVNEQKSAGDYKVEWNATGMPGGIYFCKLQNLTNTEVLKMQILK